jgi:acyl-CoA thioester hydrolase
VDVLGHINNVATAALFETARVGFHDHVNARAAMPDARWLVAALNINYLAEMRFPGIVTIGAGFASIGNSSWVILSGAFQKGVCCATAEQVIALQARSGGKFLIDDAVRAEMAPFFVKGADA